MPRIANALMGSAAVRALNTRLLGIHPDRALPRWAARTLQARWATAVGEVREVTAVGEVRGGTAVGQVPPEARSSEGGPVSVWLFNDTFTNYFHPEIGLAARKVIEAAGTSVRLAANVCCGRPLISKGLLKDARDLAAQNTTYLSALLGAAEATPLVFLEPSCLSAIREDVPALLRGEEQQQAMRVAERCLSFEEFVSGQKGRREGRPLPIRNGPSRILLHGHCHQKSMGGLPAAKALLEQIPGTQVTDLDAGCCGMAGSFGYAREHFEVSRQIGERRLLPAARGLKDGEVLVAAGTSCRQQVADFTGVRALHPAELLASLL
jgi:Fe-S oxidoreductase